jgi:superfamily I DNA/RNA helicase
VKPTAQQGRIIDHGQGALLVLAGAGSGKTSVICARAVERVLDRSCDAHSHLMLTFSRKAAREMHTRCADEMARAGRALAVEVPKVSTYHAFGYRLLRKYPGLAGRRDDPTLQDDADRKRMIRGIVKAMGMDFAKSPGRFNGWYQAYSLLKNYGLCASSGTDDERLRSLFARMGATANDDEVAVMEFARHYERRLRLTNTFDFDDLCLWAARGLRDDPGLAEQYAVQFPMITVDEAQDTNLTQYEMVNHIARHHGNITMVGDDDQAIYGWRGARVANMTEAFLRDYAAETAKLERNFRSTPLLVASAAGHIQHNTGQRMDKSPYAEGEPGNKPELACHWDDRRMADSIASSVEQSMEAGTPAHEIAVLYRTNRMARVIEGALRQRGLPYQIVGGHSLYDAPEVKAAISGARVLINGDDREALKRLLPHIPKFGEKSLERLFDTADEKGGAINAFGAAMMVGGRSMAAFEWLDQRLQTLNKWGPARAGEWVLSPEGLDYANALVKQAEKGDEAAGDADRRRSNLEALDAATGITQARQDGLAPADMEKPTLAERFAPLLEAQLDASAESDSAGGDSKVTLSTVHRAKGLEWSAVHIAGYSEGLMPLEPREDVNPARHLAEERRLSYVAVTRAKHTCVLHHAHRIKFPGSEPQEYTLSGFAGELGLAPAPANVMETPDGMMI